MLSVYPLPGTVLGTGEVKRRRYNLTVWKLAVQEGRKDTELIMQEDAVSTEHRHPAQGWGGGVTGFKVPFYFLEWHILGLGNLFLLWEFLCFLWSWESVLCPEALNCQGGEPESLGGSWRTHLPAHSPSKSLVSHTSLFPNHFLTRPKATVTLKADVAESEAVTEARVRGEGEGGKAPLISCQGCRVSSSSLSWSSGIEMGCSNIFFCSEVCSDFCLIWFCNLHTFWLATLKDT